MTPLPDYAYRTPRSCLWDSYREPKCCDEDRGSRARSWHDRHCGRGERDSLIVVLRLAKTTHGSGEYARRPAAITTASDADIHSQTTHLQLNNNHRCGWAGQLQVEVCSAVVAGQHFHIRRCHLHIHFRSSVLQLGQACSCPSQEQHARGWYQRKPLPLTRIPTARSSSTITSTICTRPS